MYSHHVRLSVGFAAIASLTFASGAAFAQASFEILPFSPALTYPAGDTFLSLSADGGSITGSYRASELNSRMGAARWDLGLGIQELDALPSSDLNSGSDFGFGMSADGAIVVGQAAISDSPSRRAAFWNRDGSVTSISSGLTGESSRAVDASADGAVILGQDSPDGYGGSSLGGFIWDASNGARGIKDLSGYEGVLVATAISDDGLSVTGIVVDEDVSSEPSEAFRWTEVDGLERLGFSDGNGFSEGEAISADGSTIVGVSGPSGFDPGRPEAFKWTEAGGMEGLGQVSYRPTGSPFYFTSRRTAAFGASADGSVVVGGGEVAWIHSEEYGGMIGVRDLLIQLGVEGLEDWVIFEAVDVSADGRVITGWANSRAIGGQDFAWRAVIPEPSTGLLVGLGLVGLAGQRHRHRVG